MPYQSTPVERIFHALGDATRMAVIERLSRGPASVSELAEPFSMALPSFTQHLRVLEAGGLVDSQKSGRVRTYRLRPQAIERSQDWLRQQAERWELRLQQLDDYLATLKE
ncbi:MAG: helix-turn-helix transcriptional regulator [Xanthomonadales bacterium]|nr:helix-turn-helix transcriptional regulator [Xanthomonadales bacterium]